MFQLDHFSIFCSPNEPILNILIDHHTIVRVIECLYVCMYVVGNESVPIQLAQCRFPGLAIFSTKQQQQRPFNGL